MTTKESLITELNTSYEKTGRGFSLNHKQNFQQCADLNGVYARAYLTDLGFEVVENGDNGRNGYAITSCGLYLSTNGYLYKVNP